MPGTQTIWQTSSVGNKTVSYRGRWVSWSQGSKGSWRIRREIRVTEMFERKKEKNSDWGRFVSIFTCRKDKYYFLMNIILSEEILLLWKWGYVLMQICTANRHLRSYFLFFFLYLHKSKRLASRIVSTQWYLLLFLKEGRTYPHWEQNSEMQNKLSHPSHSNLYLLSILMGFYVICVFSTNMLKRKQNHGF